MALNELLNTTLYKKLLNGYSILLFYCVILFVLATIGYSLDKKNGFTNGIIIGMLVSLYLWFNYGIKISKL